MSLINSVIIGYSDNVIYYDVNPKTQELSTPKNLTMKNLKNIFRFLNKEAVSLFKFKDIIPENVLHFNELTGTIIFYTKPKKQPFLFKKNDFKNAIYRVPHLLWKYEPGKVWVYALKSKPKNVDAVLFNAPFMNVYPDGSVCTGTIEFDEELYCFDDIMKEVENKFFSSYFTHTNNEDLLQMNYATFLKEYANTQTMNYSKLLVESKQTLKNLL